MAAIRTADELTGLLRSASEIEMTFESVAQWTGYIDAKQEELRSLLFSLISESQRHKGIVESLISMVNASDSFTHVPLTPRAMDFQNKSEPQIMLEIGKYEKLAYDLYSHILQAIRESDLKALLRDENNVGAFISALEELVSEEKTHVDLTAKHAGGIWSVK